MEKIEIKVQRKPWMPWEKIPVMFTTIVESAEDADKFAYGISLAMWHEVRWNYVGYSQGHYVQAHWNEKEKDDLPKTI